MKTVIAIAAVMFGAMLHSCHERSGIYDCSLRHQPQTRVNGLWSC